MKLGYETEMLNQSSLDKIQTFFLNNDLFFSKRNLKYLKNKTMNITNSTVLLLV